MSTLISTANMLALADKYAAWGDLLKTQIGRSADAASPVAGSAQAIFDELQDLITGDFDDIQQSIDLAQPVRDLYAKANWEAIVKAVANDSLAALNQHITNEGPKVNPSISSISTYLAVMGEASFDNMAVPGFADVFLACFGRNLDAAGVMQPSLNPVYNSAVSSNGIGKRAVGGSFTAGTAPNLLLYAPTIPLLEVVTDFADGSSPPQITASGTDSAGTSTTWTVTLSGNNPTSAISTTLSAGVSAGARASVALASATGVVRGSVLVIDKDMPTQEVISVDSISGSTITAVFMKAHSNGATVDGLTTVALTPVGLPRMRTLAGITITIASHSAGAVRVVGRLDRVARPDVG